MAIAKTGAMFKTLTFDGQSSRNYGVYITGEAVYNAPDRAVEMITIPGRNGAFARDDGRFENIEVTYPAGVFAENETDFAEAISDFRNMLCSRKGYCRLTDDYNPGEYREAVYKSGLEVTPALLRAGEFEITFECKPQRFLTSGETAVSVANNGTITNPTLFDANPLVAVNGYGNIDINGYSINIDSGLYGDIKILGDKTLPSHSIAIGSYKLWDVDLDTSQANNGDTMQVVFGVDLDASIRAGTSITSVTTITPPSNGTSEIKVTSRFGINISGMTFNMTVGSSFAITSVNAQYSVVYKNGNNTATATLSLTSYIEKNTSDKLTIQQAWSVTTTDQSVPLFGSNSFTPRIQTVMVDSTKSYLGNPTYLDCDLGEAYKIDNGEYIQLNSYIDLGADLPKLDPGANTITYDNTVTSFKVVPRWWQV